MVTKRISLDAFGTASPLALARARMSNDIEDLVEEEVEDDREQSSSHDQAEGAGYPHTLSTIDEGSSAGREVGLTPGSLGKSLYYTPETSVRPSDQFPLPTTDSPFAPPPRRQHLSCPPLPVTQALLSAHGDHTRALDAELQCARDLIKSLASQMAEVRHRAENAEREGMKNEEWQRKVRDLEELLVEREDGE